MNPVGPLPPKVYWIRRAMVIAVAVAVLVGLVWFVTSRAAGGSGQDPAAAAATTEATTSAGLTGVLAGGSTGAGSASSGAGSSVTEGSSGTATEPTEGTTAAARTTAQTTPKATPTSAAPKTTPKATAPKTTVTSTRKSTAPKTTAKSTPKSTAPKTTAKSTPKSTAPKTTPKSTEPATSKPETSSTAPRTTTRRTSTPPPPSTDDQGRLLCADSSIGLTVTVGSPRYPIGSQPILGMTVQNTGDQTCTRDVSGSLQRFAVYTESGERVWSTVDCFPGSGTEVRTLEPQQTLQYNIRWAGTTSQPGCTGERTDVPPGSYSVRATLDGIRATPATLVITG